MSDTNRAVVIENGSWTMKLGLAGDDEPRAVIPTLAGSSKSADEYVLAVGEKVKANYDDMCAHWVFDNDTCSNWDDMTALWQDAYSTLGVDPASRNALATVSLATPKKEREKIIEIFFEKFNVPGCYIAYDSVLALYAYGRMTGMVVDCGHSFTHIVPMYEGFALHEHYTKMPVGGKAVTEYLGKLISKKGIEAPNAFQIANIKETLCRTALNFDVDVKNAPLQKYTLPDGKSIELKEELLQSTEPYFQPKVLDPNSDTASLAKLVNDTIQACDIDLRLSLSSNIILAGGSSVIPGFTERLTKELQALNQRARVIANPNRKFGSFIGGSVLANTEAMEKEWVTRAEFKESGANIVNTKCA